MRDHIDNMRDTEAKIEIFHLFYLWDGNDLLLMNRIDAFLHVCSLTIHQTYMLSALGLRTI